MFSKIFIGFASWPCFFEEFPGVSILMLLLFSRSVHCDCSFPMSLACFLAGLPACMPPCLHACLPVCLFGRLPACLPACMLACLPAYLPPCQPASECTSFVQPSVCPSDRPSVRPPSVRRTARSAVRPTARSAVRRAPGQLHSNDTFELQLSSNSSNTVHIERNIQVGGHALALKNRSKKRMQKRRQ